MDYSSSSSRTKYSTTASTSRSSSVYTKADTPSVNYYKKLTSKEREYVSPYSDSESSTAGESRKSRKPAPSPLAKATYPTYSSTSSDASLSPPVKDKSKMSKKMSSADKEQMLRSLKTHRVNTLTELRRIEKLFDGDASKDVIEALTTGWAHYVNSNNLLSELRGMTKNYPFSSECLDEAKWQVIGDPSSTKSWNYCWLILTKIKNESLIKKHARQLAAKPAMWGGKSPSSNGVEKLAGACVSEWSRAIDSMLKQWSAPPKTPGK